MVATHRAPKVALRMAARPRALTRLDGTGPHPRLSRGGTADRISVSSTGASGGRKQDRFPHSHGPDVPSDLAG